MLKSTGVARFGWLLPHADHVRASGADALDAQQRFALKRFSEFALAWTALPPAGLDSDRLSTTYLRAMDEAHVSERMRRRDLIKFGPGFARAIEPLRVIPELAALPASDVQAAALLDRCARHPRGGTHPLNHLAIIYWLFPDWSALLQHYEAAAATAPPAAMPRTRASARAQDSRHITLIDHLKAGHSVTSAARALGIDVRTAMAWAAAQGFAASRRPKVLKGAKLDQLMACLRTGMAKSEAAQRHAVSVETVTRILLSEPGLHEAWQSARFAAARATARARWLEAIEARPHAGLKALREIASAPYAWLYRNDRAWLTEHLVDARLTDPVTRTPRVDWAARDLALSADVLRVAAAIAERKGRPKLALWEIYQVLPQLKTKLGALSKLPLTQRALDEVTIRRK